MTYAVANIALDPNFKNFARKMDPYTNVDKSVTAWLMNKKGGSIAITHNGGSVPSSQDYMAATEDCVIVADKRGCFTIYAAGSLNANATRASRQ
jgi:hypothetical protein